MTLQDNVIDIACNLVVRMGQPVMTVAKNVQEGIANAVESMAGVRPAHVNVNVCGVAAPKAEQACSPPPQSGSPSLSLYIPRRHDMTRSNAREVAVHLIYEIDYTGEDPAQAIETRMDRSYYSGLSAENDVYAERPSKKQMDYIRTCVTGVCEHAEELDALIAQYAVRWNLHRISRLTKAAMRLAIYEMRYVDDVPNGVAINECVELTRKYEDAQVVSFVNGILGSVARGAKPNTEAPADPQPEEAQPEEAQPEETPSEETQPAPEEAQQP